MYNTYKTNTGIHYWSSHQLTSIIGKKRLYLNVWNDFFNTDVAGLISGMARQNWQSLESSVQAIDEESYTLNPPYCN